MKFFGPHRPERVLLRRNTLYIGLMADNYDETFSASEATSFRSSTLRPAIVATDIPVFAFVANRLARRMAKPTVGAWNRLERCAELSLTQSVDKKNSHSRRSAA